MTPALWLLVAALLLIVVAGWCGVAQAALARTSTDDLGRYCSLLTLMRVAAEASAAVLVTLSLIVFLALLRSRDVARIEAEARTDDEPVFASG